MKRRLPRLASDEDAETFIDSANLTDYDLSRHEVVRYEFEKKSAQLNMRVPASLLSAVKRRARERGIPYTRFVREAMERALFRERDQ